ncbi:MAG TPA: bifunctional UDP-N-acetylglucosamine diphosphorylase/glucosamine-1-phosphate N-acetyltransferase GlmU [Motilibacterales bacterium]|nr:bifunctional UDP-N-acetylglucosamine diphosphorylase/glucosamine-1-phosphate N-acetyltransferase GlmU [Motilibacterales bacterium]
MTDSPVTDSAAHVSAVIVLAAGEGRRMRSATPKVLHEIGGRSLIGHAVAAADVLGADRLVVVIGHGRDAVAEHLTAVAPHVATAVQDQQLGTGHAVQCALEAAGDVSRGTVVVTYGDVPLLTGETVAELVSAHAGGGNAVTVLTARVADPTGYGRIVRAADGSVAGIVEHRDATEEQRAIDEINSGIYAFDGRVLVDSLAQLRPDNDQGELYLTDVLALARAAGGRVAALETDDVWQTEGVNDRVQLAAMRRELNRRVVEGWMRSGVTVIDPATTWVDVTVELGQDAILEPGTLLRGSTRVGPDAVVGPDTLLLDCEVGPGAHVVRTHATSARIGARTQVGPFTFLRPGTVLGDRSKAGAYVEIKNSTVGAGSKVPHLSYVGDATIGEGSNIGAATVFVNYDGVAKHATVVGDQVRIGSDTMLVAPVTIGDGAYTAAGSVITEDVPPGALGLGRARQRTVEGWVLVRREGTASANAAASAQAAAQQATAAQQAAAEGSPATPAPTGQE